MTLISPPKDNFPIEEVEEVITIPNQEHFDKFFAVPSWICPECTTKNSGHNKSCIYCRVRYHRIVSRP
jgi:hypothetical protein